MAESSESARSSSKSLRGSGKATRRKLVLAESSLKAEQYVSSLSEESGPGLGGDDSRAPAEDANNDEQPPTKRARLSDSPGAIVEVHILSNTKHTVSKIKKLNCCFSTLTIPL